MSENTKEKLLRIQEVYGEAMKKLDKFLQAYQSERETVKLLMKFEHTIGTKKNYLDEMNFLLDGLSNWIFQVINETGTSAKDKGKKIMFILDIYAHIAGAAQEARHIDWDMKAEKVKSTVGGDDDE